MQKGHPAEFYANLALGDAMIFLDNREAEVCYRAALAARPEAAVGYSAVANSLREQRRFDEALYYHAEALRRDPNDARAKCGLAATYLESDRPSDAVATCYESLKLDPNYAWTHYCLADALSALGRVDEATEHYAIIYRQAAGLRDVSDVFRAALIQAGKMKEVRETFWDKPLQDPAVGYEQSKGYPEFCLFMRNTAGYHAARATLIDRFGSTTSPEMMQQIASPACYCLLHWRIERNCNAPMRWPIKHSPRINRPVRTTRVTCSSRPWRISGETILIRQSWKRAATDCAPWGPAPS